MIRSISKKWVILALAATLVACGPPSKHDVMKKAEGAETKQELEAAIGAPDDVSRLGPLERWSYVTSDGGVDFLITGDKIRLEATTDKKPEAEREEAEE